MDNLIVRRVLVILDKGLLITVGLERGHGLGFFGGINYGDISPKINTKTY